MIDGIVVISEGKMVIVTIMITIMKAMIMIKEANENK